MRRGVAELGLAVVVVSCLGLLVVPVPAMLLDLLMLVNIGLALSIILVSVSVRRGTEFSVFPTLLLFVTLYRLALNVSSTRLILTKGTDFDGIVVRSFGSFMAGDNPVIGGVVFSILIVVQYLVITKGAERIAEVAARFNLDSLPVRLMAVESQQSAGLVSPEEAAVQRTTIQRESDFHSAMEGASRFIKGENVASLVILAINVVGGTTAAWRHHPGADAGTLLTGVAMLTVGDGLVNLISSLLVSTAAGIIVTRVDGPEGLGDQLVRQVGGEPRILALTCGFLGVTMISFGIGGTEKSAAAFGVGLSLVALARHLATRLAPEANVPAGGDGDAGCKVLDALVVRPFELELAGDVVRSLELEGTSADRVIQEVREEMARTMGVLLPPGTAAVDPGASPGAYALRIRGSSIGGGILDPDRARAAPLRQALLECVLGRCDEVMGLDEVGQILEQVARHYPTVTAEVRSGKVSLSLVHEVLRALLREGVAVREMPLILQVLAHLGPAQNHDPLLLAEDLRAALARPICARLLSDDGVLRTMVLGTDVELALHEALEAGEGRRLALDPALAASLLDALTPMVTQARRRGMPPVLVVQSVLRPHLSRLLRKRLPALAVLSFTEISRDVVLKSVGTVRLQPPA